MSAILLLGAGGLAREALAAIRAGGVHEVIGFLDDDPALWGRPLDGTMVLGGIQDVQRFPLAKLVLCTGSGASRSAIAKRLMGLGRGDDADYETVVHPSVSLTENCRIDVGCILLAGVVLTANAELGHHVVVMPNATITHDNLIKQFATVCAGVSLGGGAHIGEGAYLGMNSSVKQGVRVGEYSVLGMGGILLSDLPGGETWVGVPAQRIERGTP